MQKAVEKDNRLLSRHCAHRQHAAEIEENTRSTDGETQMSRTKPSDRKFGCSPLSVLPSPEAVALIGINAPTLGLAESYNRGGTGDFCGDDEVGI